MTDPDNIWITTPTVNPISFVEWSYNCHWLVYYWGFRVGSVMIGSGETAFFRSVTGHGRMFASLTELMLMLDRVAAQAGMLSAAMLDVKAAA